MTTKEAQSEAPSVDMREMLLDLAALGTFNDDTTNYKLIDEVEAKINRLITEARIDELKQLLGRQWWADDQHHEDEVVPYHHIEAQIKLLSNNLSKGDGNGN